MAGRKYEEVWVRIKKYNRCTLDAAPQLHRRITKAVIKEKNLDVTFKVENEERKLRLKIEKKGSRITFLLVSSISLADL